MSALLRATRTSLGSPLKRQFHTSGPHGVKVLAVLYRGGQAAKEEKRLLGTLENKLGIASWLEDQGFVVTDDKEGPDSVFQKEIQDAEILITTPFHPGYLTSELFDKAKNLKLCVTAGVGSDHIDLNAANRHKVTVAEVTGSNVVSVAEHVRDCLERANEKVILSILLLVRNYNVGHEQIIQGKWEVGQAARDSYDLEGKVVGTVGAGRIGYRVLERLQGFNCKKLLYFDYTALPEGEYGLQGGAYISDAANAVKAHRVEKLEDMLAQCDVVTINAPLHEGTKGLFNKALLGKMKKGSWLVNTARGAICVAEDVKAALETGHLLGYAGDVWNVQPAPPDHPWRNMRNPHGGGNGMVPHMSGTTLDAQARYAAGTKEIIRRYFANETQKPADLIVENGEYATKAYGQRSKK